MPQGLEIHAVQDNCAIHKRSTIKERPSEMVRCPEFRLAPKHENRLPIAERALVAAVHAWAKDVDERQRGVDWQMKVTGTRCKPESGYSRVAL